jgi:murein DD-endopeptidase MepM/ murein hydrolase activator NlpD
MARAGPSSRLHRPSLEQLQRTVAGWTKPADWHTDLFIFSESRLFQARLKPCGAQCTAGRRPGRLGLRLSQRPHHRPRRLAHRAGLPGRPGTPIVASAGGVVLGTEWHPEYGHTVEVDHGNGLVTRYAHCLKVLVSSPGPVVKRGQAIAEVGNSGRSTGPHLHFEVLVDGVPQDPARFLAPATPDRCTAAPRHGASADRAAAPGAAAGRAPGAKLPALHGPRAPLAGAL